MQNTKLTTPQEKVYMKSIQIMLADSAYIYATILYS